MVTFSGAALLESDSSSETPPQPDVFDDDYSQYISVDRDVDGGTATSENTATLATFQDVFKAFLRHTPWDSREHLNTKAGLGVPRGLQTRASSTFDGLDVYSHDNYLKSRRSLQLSCIDLLDMDPESSFRTPSAFGRLRLRSDLMLDSYRSESDSESSSGKPSHLVSPSLPLINRCVSSSLQDPLLQFIRFSLSINFSFLPPQKSRFSTTTTSTSNYVDVTASAAQSTCMSDSSPIPEWTGPGECVSPSGSWPFLPRRRRLLRKRRALDGDATPTTTSSPPSTPRKVTPNSPMSPTLSSPSFSSRVFSLSSAVVEERRGLFSSPLGSPVTSATTPPNTPSKSPRLNLRFAFLPKRKQRRTSSDSDGWVYIEVTPIIRQRYIPDLDED